MRRCKRLVEIGLRRCRSRSSKNWEEVIRHVITHLQLTEGMTQDKRAWRSKIRIDGYQQSSNFSLPSDKHMVLDRRTYLLSYQQWYHFVSISLFFSFITTVVTNNLAIFTIQLSVFPFSDISSQLITLFFFSNLVLKNNFHEPRIFQKKSLYTTKVRARSVCTLPCTDLTCGTTLGVLLCLQVIL